MKNAAESAKTTDDVATRVAKLEAEIVALRIMVGALEAAVIARPSLAPDGVDAAPAGDDDLKARVRAIEVQIGALTRQMDTFLGKKSPKPKVAAPDTKPEAAKEEEAAKAAAIYVDLHPAFTVNLQGKSKARFLQASVQVLTREPKVEEQIKQHSPMIRNQLMLLFSGKTSQDLRTVEGKETLQNEARSAIENVLKSESGKGGVEAVFFTSFVMQ